MSVDINLQGVSTVGPVMQVPFLLPKAMALIMNANSTQSPLIPENEPVAPCTRIILTEPIKNFTKFAEQVTHTQGIICDRAMHIAIKGVLYGMVSVYVPWQNDAGQQYGWLGYAVERYRKALCYFKPGGIAYMFLSGLLNVANNDYTSSTRSSDDFWNKMFTPSDKDNYEHYLDLGERLGRQACLDTQVFYLELKMDFFRNLGQSLSCSAAGLTPYKWTLNFDDIEKYLVKEHVTARDLLGGAADASANLWTTGDLQLRVRPVGCEWGSRALRTEYNSNTALKAAFLVVDAAVFAENTSAQLMKTDQTHVMLEQYTHEWTIHGNDNDNVPFEVEMRSILHAPLAASFFACRRSDDYARGDFYKVHPGSNAQQPDLQIDPFVLVTKTLNGTPAMIMSGDDIRKTYCHWSTGTTLRTKDVAVFESLRIDFEQHSFAVALNRVQMGWRFILHKACFATGSAILTGTFLYYNTANVTVGMPSKEFYTNIGLGK